MKIVSSAPALASLPHPAACSSPGEAAGSSCCRGYPQWLRVGTFTAELSPRWALSLLPCPYLAHSWVLPCPSCHLCVPSALRGGLALAPCCPRMEAPQNSWLQEPLLSSAASLPRPFPSSRTAPTPRCSGGHRVEVAASQGGSPCQGQSLPRFVWALSPAGTGTAALG